MASPVRGNAGHHDPWPCHSGLTVTRDVNELRRSTAAITFPDEARTS